MSRPLLDDAVLKLIDAKLALNGHVTSVDIYRHLGLSRQKVSKVFQDYLAANPDSMHYVPAKRKYMASQSFKPCFLGDVPAGVYVDALTVVFGVFDSH
ncbi:hypothetical protein [Vibrio chagasii]|uniref:DNA-binding transcriptional repressor CapW winged helix-turn-helix domain-containing protein n=1 Tax=Vibrio chagasii TaxID=170679 RepID=A0A7Y3YTT6_9VIBR|nr:hypothetical protein [Vibrio chagasii]NOH36586.1 hypothetical protein [Vibrio chagasii]